MDYLKDRKISDPCHHVGEIRGIESSFDQCHVKINTSKVTLFNQC